MSVCPGIPVWGTRYRKREAINKLKGTILRTNYLYREPSDDKLYKSGYLTSAVKDIKLSADDIENLFNNLNNLGTKEAKDLIKRLRYYIYNGRF